MIRRINFIGVNDFTGQYCEKKLSLCDRPNPCFNNGTCVKDKCQCLSGFFGEFCQSKPFFNKNYLKFQKILPIF